MALGRLRVDISQGGRIEETQMGVSVDQSGHQGGAAAIDDIRITGFWRVPTRHRRDLISPDQHRPIERFGPRPVDHRDIGEKRLAHGLIPFVKKTH